MDLRTYLTAIRKSWLLIILTTVLGGGAGAVLFLMTPPVYATTVDFYVSSPGSANSNPQSSGQFAQARVDSYIVLLSSDEMARRVVALTGVGLTPQQISSQIQASAEQNTVVVNATITDGSPERSLQLAQGVAEGFPKLVDELDNGGRVKAVVAVSVISGPNLGPAPISPDPTLDIGLGLGAGLVLGVVIAIAREVLDNSVRSAETAQRLVGAPVIGTILYDPETKRSPLIVGDESTSARSESFRQLRTNLEFVDVSSAMKTIMVTSSLPLEGKSTTAVNLALSFAELGERVLLVDADLRRPRLGEFLGLPQEVGLTNVLVGQVDLPDAIQPYGDGGLSLLASGSTPPNPSELLGSARMREVVAQAGDRFDKIVIDTPPVLPVTDAAVASAYADGVVFVVRHGRTTRAQVTNSATALDNVDARIVGSVINMKKSNRSEQRRYGRHAYASTDRAPRRSSSTPVNWDHDSSRPS